MISFCSFLSQVTEEILSILGLLRPLTESESSPPEPSHGVNRLDASLSQLQNVARELAISHTKQVKATPAQLKLLTLIMSQFELISVGMLPGKMFALHIQVELKHRFTRRKFGFAISI